MCRIRPPCGIALRGRSGRHVTAGRRFAYRGVPDCAAPEGSIRGLAAFTGEGRGVVHVFLDGEAVAICRAALGRAGIGIADEREVLVVDVEDRPLALGELTRQLADANVNVDLAYTAFGGVKIVIATDDLASARAALR